MKRIIVLIFTALAFQNGYANTPTLYPAKTKTGFVSRLNFEPLIANPIEGRVGAMYQFTDNKLRLDIGNSLDFGQLGAISIGADFFTFTRLRSEENFKFPVETSDYFFGVNFARGTSTVDDGEFFEYSVRLRLAHISSHLVDGFADTSGQLIKKPLVYSREFADLVVAIESDQLPKNKGKLRGYIGTTSIWATQPRDVNRFIPQLGLEYKYLIFKSIEAFAAYDFKMIGIDNAYVGTSAWQVGIRGATNYSPTISLNIYGYHGRSMHGMFYKEKDSYVGTGFQFLF